MATACYKEASIVIVLDANYILRYLLNDNPAMFTSAKEVIERDYCLVLNEVVAEVVYVLSGVYNVPRTVIAETLTDFIMMENITQHESKDCLCSALHLYQAKKLDFIDCYLCAISKKYTIKTFDKKLNKCLKN